MPFLAIYMTRQGYTVGQTGLAVSAYGAGHICSSQLGGFLADRVGRRNTIAASMFLSAICMLALSQARGFLPILLITFLTGAATELYRPAASALIGDLVTPDQRLLAFAVYRFAINLGFAIGPATAGFLADHSFLYLFVGDAMTSLAFGFIALVALPHGLRGQADGEHFTEVYRVAVRDRRFMVFLLATLCVTFVEFQLHSTFPIHLALAGFSTSTYGLLLSVNGVLIIFFELMITSWTQRFAAQTMIAVGYALSAIGFALTGLAHSVPALVGTVVVWTVGEMIYAPVTGAYVTNIAPEKYRGRYNGMWMMMWSLGMVLGPALGTVIYANEPLALWLVCGALGVLGAALALYKVPSNTER